MCPSDIKYEKRIRVACLSVVFLFDVKFLFLTKDNEE